MVGGAIMAPPPGKIGLNKTHFETSKVVCPGAKSISIISVKLSNCLTVISLIISGSIVEIHGVTPTKEKQ